MSFHAADAPAAVFTLVAAKSELVEQSMQAVEQWTYMWTRLSVQVVAFALLMPMEQ